MFFRKTLLIAMALSFAGVMAYAQENCANCPMATKSACAATLDTTKKGDVVYTKLPGYNKKVMIGDGYYFTYKFNKRPQIGTLSLIVKVYTKDGKQVKPFEITGESGMPSMKGAHDSGQMAFKLNRLGDYLLPVSVVMRGKWEVKLVFSDKDKQPVYNGVFEFSV